MKGSKKILSLVAVLTMFVMIIAGCTPASTPAATTTTTQATTKGQTGTTAPEMVGNTYVKGLPIVKDSRTLKIAVSWHQNDEYVKDYSKKPFVSKAEKATGIKIQWITPTTEQVTTMLAGNDMPDGFVGLLGDSSIVQNPSLFAPIGDLVSKYAPHVLSLYQDKIPEWKEFLTYPDGKIYGLMAGYYQSYLHLTDSVSWINTTWLKKVGKETPKTVDEFYDVLKAFRDQDADGNGNANDETPLDFANKQWAGGIKYLAGPWGIQGYFNLVNNKISATVNTQNYRDFLQFYNKLVVEKLVNAEGFSQTTEQYYANISNLKDGVFLGWAPPTFMSKDDAIKQYAPLPILSVPGKESLRTTWGGSKKATKQSRNGFVIAATSKEKEAALRWWDYLSTDQDMAMLVAWGEPGVGYEKNTDGKYYVLQPSADILKSLNLTSATALKASIGLINCHPLVLNNLSVDAKKYPTLSDACRQVGIDALYQFMPEQTLPRTIIPADKQEQLTLIQTDLESFINSFMSDSILNGVTDAKWNTYVNQLKSYKYDAYLQWYQDYVDGKIK